MKGLRQRVDRPHLGLHVEGRGDCCHQLNKSGLHCRDSNSSGLAVAEYVDAASSEHGIVGSTKYFKALAHAHGLQHPADEYQHLLPFRVRRMLLKQRIKLLHRQSVAVPLRLDRARAEVV